MTENQTIEITPTIAHPDFMAVHPELYHYTNLDGLKGILSTKSLWATHFANLNDSTEVTLLEAQLSAAVAAGIREVF